MAKSPAFARIRRDVVAAVARVPRGRTVTFAEIAAALDVAPRHVAYILATLDPLERETIPWHRALAAGGRLGDGKRRDDQRPRLAEEGFSAEPDGTVRPALPKRRPRPD